MHKNCIYLYLYMIVGREYFSKLLSLSVYQIVCTTYLKYKLFIDKLHYLGCSIYFKLMCMYVVRTILFYFNHT